MSIVEKINIPNGTYRQVIGKDSKNIILYSQYGMRVTLPNKGMIVIESDDPIKIWNVKMDILSNIGGKYSIFEHPGIITNLVVYDKQQPFQFKKYKEDIQDKYRIVYTNEKIPQVVKAIAPNNDWQIYSREKLVEALNRNINITYEVTIGRNTFYSASKTKEIKGVESKLYYMNNFRTISVGYGKDIKVKWDPILTDKQYNYVLNKLNKDNITKQYVKSGSIIIDIENGTRIHCAIELDNGPKLDTFKSKVEKHIKETVIISRLDMFPDIRYKFTVPSTKNPNITIQDITIGEDLIMKHVNEKKYLLSYSYINSVIKYEIDGIIIKFLHNISNDTYVIKFSSKTIPPINIIDYINDMFGIK